jgi:hypothetical protein
MKIIYNNVIPFDGFTYINLFGILFGRNEYKGKLKKSTINHESIHTEQYKDLGYILYLPLYILEWIVKIPFGWFYTKMKYGRKISNIAYRSISFEQEAYYNQYDYDYLNKRKRYSWVKYIFTMYDPDKETQRVGTEIYI